MYLKVPIGFSFQSPKTTKQIVDNQVVKFLRTWQKQRIYKPSYGMPWQDFDYTIYKDPDDLNRRLINFVSVRFQQDLPEVSVVSIDVTDNNRDRNNFSFNLVYKYKKLFQSAVLVSLNLNSQVEVQLSAGSF